MGRSIGIDAHRDFLQVTIRHEGKVVSRSRVTTDRRTLSRFAASLEGDDRAVIESTSFAWPIAQLLAAHGVQVTISNPAKTKAIAQAKVKSDKVDADTLAMLCEADLIASVWMPDPVTLVLRRQVASRQQLVRHRTSLRRQVSSLLQRNLIRPPVTDTFGVKGRAWLAVLELPDHDRFALDGMLRMHDATQAEITRIEKVLASEALDRPDVRLLMTIPGMGFHTALAVCATIGDPARFTSARKLVGYLGLDPRVKQSGNGPIRTGRISKQGSVHTRALLVEAATSAVRTPGPLRAFYQRLRAKKGHNVAVCAVAHKLTTIVWHMLKNGEAYRYSLPSLTERKLYELERLTGQPHAHRDRYRTQRAQERTLLEQAQRNYQTHVQTRARASHRDRDTSSQPKPTNQARQPHRSQQAALHDRESPTPAPKS
jgi:transposase